MWYIYRITNLINGKTYIGQHMYKSVNDDYFGSGKHLIRSIKRYGRENFRKDILVSRIPDRKHADIAEQNYIKKERSQGKGEYNILDGGEGFTGHHRKDSRKKISHSLMGNQRAKGKNLGNQNAKGNVLSETTRKQMGLSRIGNTNNGITLIRCVETGEVHRTLEWKKLGYRNAYSVVHGRQKTCNGKHFVLADKGEMR